MPPVVPSAQRRPPTRAFRMISAVSGPGVTMTTVATPTNGRRPPSTPLRGDLLQVRRVRARAREAVQLRPLEVRRLPGSQVRVLAAPCLERGRLERAPVRERELPRVRAH